MNAPWPVPKGRRAYVTFHLHFAFAHGVATMHHLTAAWRGWRREA